MVRHFTALLLLVRSNAQVEVEPASSDGLEIYPRATKIYAGVTPKLRIEGTGFEGDGTNIHVSFLPGLPRESYSVVVNSPSSMSVLLKGGVRWPLPLGLTEMALKVMSLKDDLADDPDHEYVTSPIQVATILGTPSIVNRADKLVYMSGTRTLNINGTNFRQKETNFIFDPPLFRDVDYTMLVTSPQVAHLTLKQGRKWRSDGVPGPLKIKRLGTGAGDLKIDAKFGGVTVAEVQVDLGAHGVTVEPSSDRKVYQSTPSLTILGSGFNATGSRGGNTLRWGNSLRGLGVNYTITDAQANTLTLALTPGSKWRANPNNLPGPLTLLAVNAGAGPVPVGATEAKKGRTIAIVYADPSITESTAEIARTLSHLLWVKGSGFVMRQTTLTVRSLEADGSITKLTPLVDYLTTVFNSTHTQLALRDGKAWSAAPGASIQCTSLDTGAGPVAYVSTDAPVVLAKTVADAEHSNAKVSVTRTATTQQLYSTPKLKKLTITGDGLCSDNKVVMPADVKLTFDPAIDTAVYSVVKVKATEITLDLNQNQHWPVGVIKVTELKCDAKSAATVFAGGEGVAVATVLPDPTIEAQEDLVLYTHHSRRLVLHGTGFSIDGTTVTLDKTPADAFYIAETLTNYMALELNDDPDDAWIDPSQLPEDASKGVTLAVTSVTTSAGVFQFPNGGVVVATVHREPEGDVCDDSCEWANDGICDDGTQPRAWDDEGEPRRRYYDDDYGGFIYDDDDDMYYAYGFDGAHYAGYDDYTYGFLRNFEDDMGAGDYAVCDYGTDCTDCQPRGGDGRNKEVGDTDCSNTCQYARDGYCDDGRDGMPRYCTPGTDCQDCGPVGSDNYTKYDDEFWDDDGRNWYFEDDYWDDASRGGLDDFYYYGYGFDDYFTPNENATDANASDSPKKSKATVDFEDDDGTAIAGYVKSQPNPFAIDPEVTSGGDSLASLVIAGLFVGVLSLAACGALRFGKNGKKGGCLPFSAKAKDETARELSKSWAEMTGRQNEKSSTAQVPITPDVTYSGSSN